MFIKNKMKEILKSDAHSQKRIILVLFIRILDVDAMITYDICIDRNILGSSKDKLFIITNKKIENKKQQQKREKKEKKNSSSLRFFLCRLFFFLYILRHYIIHIFQ